MYSKQCAAVEGDRKNDLEMGVVAELIEEVTALLTAVVHSAAYVVYKRRQRGLREPLGGSKDSYFDGIREKRR